MKIEESDADELFDVLDLISAEFQSDQCFNSRIMDRAKAITDKLRTQRHFPGIKSKIRGVNGVEGLSDSEW